jgi:TRAP-type mannitol/chloroaromatic compound transport system permease small subunit
MSTTETAMERGYLTMASRKATVLERSDKIIDYTMRTIIVIITIMASCTMLLQVIARYIFEVAISGLDEITGHTAVWLYLMGAAYGSFNRSQIKAEMIHLVIKNQRILYSVRAISTLIGAVVAGYMVTELWVRPMEYTETRSDANPSNSDSYFSNCHSDRCDIDGLLFHSRSIGSNA